MGVLMMGAKLLEIYTRAADFWKLPFRGYLQFKVLGGADSKRAFQPPPAVDLSVQACLKE